MKDVKRMFPQSFKLNKVLISVCLFVCPIITHESLGRFSSNFDWGTLQNLDNSVEPWELCRTSGTLQNLGNSVEPWELCRTSGTFLAWLKSSKLKWVGLSKQFTSQLFPFQHFNLCSYKNLLILIFHTHKQKTIWNRNPRLLQKKYSSAGQNLVSITCLSIWV